MRARWISSIVQVAWWWRPPEVNFGKTYALSIWLLREAWNRYQSVNWWVAPILRQAKISAALMQKMLPQSRYRMHVTDQVIELLRSDGRTHSVIEFKSADNSGSLRGEGVHAMVIDEAALLSRASYESCWTTLTRTMGKLRIVSTPKGRNFFFEEFLKGESSDYAEYKSFRLPTHLNPYVSREALDAFKRNLPADVYRQEILAEFLDGSAGSFRKIGKSQRATWLNKPNRNAQYVMGVDWARHHDYTIFMIGDVDTKEVVHLERWNDVDWNLQIDRCIRMAKYWNNAQIVMDSTGVGDVPHDQIRSVYPHSEGYAISNNAAKVPLIQELQLAFEREEISIPDPATEDNGVLLSRILQGELERYGYSLSSMGKFIFSAPQGYFDDCVIALALCWYGMNKTQQHYKWRSVRGV